MNCSNDCIVLIQHFEGCANRMADGRLKAYPDPASGGAPWTIGYGSTGPDITQSTIWTQQQADDRLKRDAMTVAGKIERLLDGAKTTQNQFDALVCFAYNLGVGNLGTSTLLKKHKAGDYAGAKAEFPKWNKAAGKVLAGLTTRRNAEADLYGKE